MHPSNAKTIMPRMADTLAIVFSLGKKIGTNAAIARATQNMEYSESIADSAIKIGVEFRVKCTVCREFEKSESYRKTALSFARLAGGIGRSLSRHTKPSRLGCCSPGPVAFLRKAKTRRGVS